MNHGKNRAKKNTNLPMRTQSLFLIQEKICSRLGSYNLEYLTRSIRFPNLRNSFSMSQHASRLLKSPHTNIDNGAFEDNSSSSLFSSSLSSSVLSETVDAPQPESVFLLEIVSFPLLLGQPSSSSAAAYIQMRPLQQLIRRRFSNLLNMSIFRAI